MDVDQAVTRRTALVGGIAVVGAATALAGCASSSSGGSPPASTAPAGSGAGPAALAKLADVPVGGSVAATGPDGPIVLAQPTAGDVVAFTAICTHMGCTVKAAGKELDCPCHGSKYDAFTGTVINGPAPKPLAAVPVRVSGTDVVLA